MDELFADLNAAAINYRLYEDVCYATRLLAAAEALLDEYDLRREEARGREKVYAEWLRAIDYPRSTLLGPYQTVPEVFAGPKTLRKLDPVTKALFEGQPIDSISAPVDKPHHFGFPDGFADTTQLGLF
ncbi:hypothetical protein A5630_25220 [Mycolicibacterium mucogenicum]|uniref:Uncharacterized protein n=1 Tax=Mycolicibacterium mucogenicum TaxID=56689 RepID=A0A1A3GY33_MYCMU|nr:hypothetical protein [Mycolicibacterium mucogenicum]OBJ40254.1 hypothetical protein A5630_25220 [Mycolicibacterium mucogenicum]